MKPIDTFFPYTYTLVDKLYNEIYRIRDAVPFFVYKRIPLDAFRVYFGYKIDFGFTYLLRKIYCVYADLYDVPVHGAHVYAPLPPLYIEFYDVTAYRSKQVSPIPIPLLASGGNSNMLQYNAISPVDQNGYGVEFDARPVKYSQVLNYMYRNRNDINISITGQNPSLGQYIDVMFEGYNIPERSLLLWS